MNSALLRLNLKLSSFRDVMQYFIFMDPCTKKNETDEVASPSLLTSVVSSTHPHYFFDSADALSCVAEV